jgi:hypothetical protein
VSEDVSYVAARRPAPNDQGDWGLYLPDQQRWVDVVFRSKLEAERLIDEMQEAEAE